MIKQKFLKEIEHTIFTSILTQTNLLLGQSKTAFLATGLFLNLPAVIKLEQTDNLEDISKNPAITDLINSISTDISEEKVVFTIFYKDKKYLKQLVKVINKYIIYFSYKYFAALQTILRKHTTNAYQASMFRIVQNKERPFTLIRIASMYAINSFIIELLNLTNNNNNKWETIKSIIPVFQDNTLKTEFAILSEMAKSAFKLKIKKVKGKYVKVSTVNMEYITEEKQDALPNDSFSGAESIGKQDRSMVTLSNQLQQSISTSTKGTAIGKLMNQLFDEIKIDANWFNKLKKSFETTMYHKTQGGSTSWENISQIYRHIYTAPVTQNTESKVKLIISIDTSGSIHTTELQKVLSIIKQHSKKIAEVYVYHHTSDIIAQYHIVDANDIQNSHKFKQAFSCRMGTGGTSHFRVFKTIKKLKIKNPEEWVYICMSDMYSDIESALPKYPIISKLTPYWLTTSDGRKFNPSIVGGTTIIMP